MGVEKNKRLKSMLVTAVLVLLIASIASVLPTGAQDSNVVSIADVTIAAEESEIVPIMIYNATGVGSIGVKLSYNASVVNVAGATQGDFTAFFGFDNSNAANGWITINTYISGTELTGDVKVADVTLEAVGNGGGSSPLNLEILSMSDKSGNDLQGTTENSTFTIKPQGLNTASSITASPIPPSSTTPDPHNNGGHSGIPGDVTDEETSTTPTPTATATATLPAASPASNPLIPGFEAVFAIAGLLAVAYLFMKQE